MNIRNRIKTLEKHFTPGITADLCDCYEKWVDALLYDDDKSRSSPSAGFDIEPDGNCALCRLPVPERVKEVCRQIVMFYG